jgi:hypothetical protein
MQQLQSQNGARCVAPQLALTGTQCLCWGVVGVCIVCKCNSSLADDNLTSVLLPCASLLHCCSLATLCVNAIEYSLQHAHVPWL